MILDASLRQKIHSADKCIRNREYPCLAPGCGKQAIRSHAVQRSLLIEAIAEDKHVYTQPPSFMSIMRMRAPTDPIEIELTGINNASTFKGFCSEHDKMLFAPAEDRTKIWHSTAISLHLRSISFEYSRKRFVRDFYIKLLALVSDPAVKAICVEAATQFGNFMLAFEKTYLGAVNALICGSPIDTVDYTSIPFTRNLQVSCCGLFQSKEDDFSSSICYNLISYEKVSLLTLTAFKYRENHLEDFRNCSRPCV